MSDNHHAHALQPKTRLQEFEIVGVLGSGSPCRRHFSKEEM